MVRLSSSKHLRKRFPAAANTLSPSARGRLAWGGNDAGPPLRDCQNEAFKGARNRLACRSSHRERRAARVDERAAGRDRFAGGRRESVGPEKLANMHAGTTLWEAERIVLEGQRVHIDIGFLFDDHDFPLDARAVAQGSTRDTLKDSQQRYQKVLY